MMIWIELVIIALAILMEGFFSGSETALVSCNRMKIRHRVEKGRAGARILWSMLQDPHRILATMLVGTNICVVTATIIATDLCLKVFQERGSLVAMLIMTPLVLCFGEMIPKAVFRIYSDRILVVTAPLLAVLQKILMPVVVILEWLSGIIIRGFGLKQGKRNPFMSKEDIELLVQQITSEGVLEMSEQEAIHQIFDFRYIRVGDIMMTLQKVVSIDYNDGSDAIIERARKYGFTRYPVLENRRVKGILNIFDIYYNEGNWHDFIRPVRKVYPNQRIAGLFMKMKRNKELMAVVIRNEKMVGIATLQDIIDEIELI